MKGGGGGGGERLLWRGDAERVRGVWCVARRERSGVGGVDLCVVGVVAGVIIKKVVRWVVGTQWRCPTSMRRSAKKRLGKYVRSGGKKQAEGSGRERVSAADERGSRA